MGKVSRDAVVTFAASETPRAEEIRTDMKATRANISRTRPVISPRYNSLLPLTVWLEALTMVNGRIRSVQMRVRYLR